MPSKPNGKPSPKIKKIIARTTRKPKPKPEPKSYNV